ncbi:MAG: P-type conjugative transfer protein TrbG [Alphaproteobacteria bacterium]|uniref:Type IV secretion system protein PtlF n=1 Tax=Brevundimonas mediterranea TaxID=74329 RepID=A0A7Z9C6R0_9CAUL|nr:P-type conjugative transfer protein TrbG [Brevundimonas mediterranea]MBU2031168.1 P-type conjugative transfer protein TrbG [Alphaproteobacteria bacterium]TAJ40639.1 MAG: P-type conjugative transfer protein TrbG [Brevundimonas sp.]MBU2163927.1 P-type conjugative transfer protein TrbG [Alphaproteobacteria bacterium]MBU2230375.1 P-type conjugative transfer protein TrbG [Alphaproteobacteria bacterium]VDC50088.1 Type IV secretion system protein PtlF [Brevundimonas mediterranea]
MDPRRLLILAASGLLLSGCALLRAQSAPPGVSGETMVRAAAATASAPEPLAVMLDAPVAVDEPVTPEPVSGTRPYEAAESPEPQPVTRSAAVSGRAAIAAANVSARAPSRSDDFVGGVQVFAWSPGRVFEVWTAPLRVTTLTLAPGETLQSKAAGDTVRWQIGEASSGSGTEARTHVMLKPLERGLETNLILTTNRRVYLIDLKSGAADAFNAAVAWDAGASAAGTEAVTAPLALAEVRVPDPVVTPEGPLDGRYRIEPQGRRARWTPTAVFNDGVRTFITLDPDVQVDEAPVLFVVAPDGETQMVNYRQVGGLFVVDRVFDRAELRLGDRHPQIVRIRRVSGGRS